MKRCPTCQKEFADSMRFCQTDGTPLVELAAEASAPTDPYKTIVGGAIKMDADLLQLPEQDDPNKTMVSPLNITKPEAPKLVPPPKPIDEPILNIPATPEKKESVPPKFGEPILSPPNFGDSSAKTPSSGLANSSQSSQPSITNEPPPTAFGASPFSNDANNKDAPFGNAPDNAPNSSPFDKPSSVSSPFDKPASIPPSASPFDKTPPPPYKTPEPMFGGQQPPSSNQSPFGQPQTPFGQSNEPFDSPVQQNEWAPPPAPVAGWQDQGLGADTPFQPPMATVGQDQTLAIVSLVCGILSICLCGIFTGIPAVITGFMAKNKADANPSQFGGRGMALAGLITGGIGTVLGVIGLIYYILIIASAGF